MIPVEEIVNCKDCTKYIRIGYDAIEVEQFNTDHKTYLNYDKVYNCKDCYKPNKYYEGDSVIILDRKLGLIT